MQEAEDPKFSSRVSLNAVSNVLRTAIMAVTGLIMVPYYIGEMGFGIYAVIFLATTITTYFVAVSDSIAQAFTRYMTLSMNRGDLEDSNRVFSTTFIGMLRCVLVMTAVCAILSISAPYVFNTGDATALDVQMLFFMVLVASLMLSFSSCLGSVFMACNKMYIMYVAKTVYILVQIAVVVAVFELFGPSLMVIGASNVVAAIVCLAIMAFYIPRVAPGLKASRNRYDPVLLKEMGGLAIWTLLSEIGSLLFIHASLIVVNLIAGNEEQAVFSIVANVASMVGTVCTAMSAAAVPLAYRCYSEKDMDGMERTLKLFSKTVGSLMAFVLAFLTVFAPQVIGVWLGQGYDEVIPLMRAILPVEVVVCAAGALIDVPVLFVRMRMVAIFTGVMGAMNIGLAALILLFTDFGLMGVCWAWALTVGIMKFVFYPVLAGRLLGKGSFAFHPPFLISLALYAVSVVVLHLFSIAFEMPTSLILLAVVALASMAIYVVASVRLVFSKDERSELVTYLPMSMQSIAGKLLLGKSA